MAHPAGLEPATRCLEGNRSIQLSYECVKTKSPPLVTEAASSVGGPYCYIALTGSAVTSVRDWRRPAVSAQWLQIIKMVNPLGIEPRT